MADSVLPIEQDCSEYSDSVRLEGHGKLQSVGEIRMGCTKLFENSSGTNRKLNTRCWTVIAVGDRSWSQAFYGRESPAWRACGKWPLVPELFPSICLYNFSISVTKERGKKRTHVLLSLGPQEAGSFFLSSLGGQKKTHIFNCSKEMPGIPSYSIVYKQVIIYRATTKSECLKIYVLYLI